MGDPTVDHMIDRLSNWGRWGPDDELGTANFITPEKRVDGSRLVKSGRTFSLAIPFDRFGPQPAGGRRMNPHHMMLLTGTDVRTGAQPGSADGLGGADDLVVMPLQAATQWDALAHAFYDYRMYNNRGCELVDADGAHKNSITVLRDRLVTRGILVDLPRHKGIGHLPLGHRITVSEIEAALEAQGVTPSSGDVLLLRTGNLGRARAAGWAGYCHGEAPGIGLDSLPWIHEMELSAIAADTWALEVIPNDEAGIDFPVHAVALVHMGLLIGEIFDLDELAEDCVRDGVYEFLFVAPPLPITGAVGSPVNPLAIK